MWSCQIYVFRGYLLALWCRSEVKETKSSEMALYAFH